MLGELLSTGGTFKTLKDAGVAVKEVAGHTGFPEMMDGRVKTRTPKFMAGFSDGAVPMTVMDANDIPPIDLIVVNHPSLKPLPETTVRTRWR